VLNIETSKQLITIMPAPNPLNQICDICKAFASKNGFNKAGEQKYVCRRHTPSWGYYGSGSVGNPSFILELDDRPLTDYERTKRCREKKAIENPPKKRGRPKTNKK